MRREREGEGRGGAPHRRSYSRVEKINRRLEVINSTFLQLIAAVRSKPFRYAASSLTHRQAGLVESWYDSQRLLGYVTIRSSLIMKGSDLTYCFYISAQESPLRPYQAERIVRRLGNLCRRLSPGLKSLIVFNAAGATVGAYKIFTRNGIYLARKAEKIIKYMARLFEKRWQALKAALAGRRVYGPVALLALLLTLVLKRLGVEVIDEMGIIRLMDAVKSPRYAVSLDELPTPPPDTYT